MPFDKIGSALSGAGSLVRGLSSAGAFGQPGSGSTEHLKYGIRWRVNDAKKAGIHPLFALGANIGSPMAGQSGMTGSGVGDALSDLGRSSIEYGSRREARRERGLVRAAALREEGRRERLLDAQIRESNARATRDYVGAALEASQIGRLKQSANYRQDPGPLPPPRKPERGLKAFGKTVLPHPGFSDAEDWQQRVGEPAEWALAGPIAAADLYWSLYQRRERSRYYQWLSRLRKPQSGRTPRRWRRR